MIETDTKTQDTLSRCAWKPDSAAHSPKMDVLNTSHHGGAGSSLGFRDTTEIKVAQEPFPEFTCTVSSELNLLGCIWFFQPLPWVSKVKLRLLPPEQLHGQGVLQLSMSWSSFEKCRINEALLWLICTLILCPAKSRAVTPTSPTMCNSHCSSSTWIPVGSHNQAPIFPSAGGLMKAISQRGSSLDLRNLKCVRPLLLVTSVKCSGSEGWRHKQTGPWDTRKQGNREIRISHLTTCHYCAPIHTRAVPIQQGW